MNYVTGDIFVMSPPKQTLRAWKPFWDCVDILFEFQNSDVADGNEELSEWRLNWVAGITLLRTIGHVLDKMDSKISQQHSIIIKGWWQGVKSDRANSHIFWDFIEKERNNLLKTYSFDARFVLHGEEGPCIEFGDGEDAFELFRQAIYWWRYQLMDIEAALS